MGLCQLDMSLLLRLLRSHYEDVPDYKLLVTGTEQLFLMEREQLSDMDGRLNTATVRCLDPDVSGIVRYMGHFKHGPHHCLEFELLNMSLLNLTEDAEDKKLPLMQIRDILKQAKTGVMHQSIWYRGDVIDTPSFSYLVEDLIGDGVYGTVARCLKTATTADPGYRNVMVRGLRCLDPDVSGIVRYMGHFKHGPHHCLEFELLNMSLLNLTEDAEDKKLPLMQIRDILKQMATALEYLGHLEIIHTDLKLQNIMVSRRGRFKLIDFGLSMYECQANSGDVCQTIWYRSPEIMLGLPFTRAIDMWSLGCIAAELLTGFPMYPGNNEYEMEYSEMWEKDPLSGCVPTKTLEAVVQAGNVPITSSFPDLLKRMLELDPDKRITPSELLEHPFISTPHTRTERVPLPHTSCADQEAAIVPHTHCADQEGASVDHSNSWSSESSVDHSNSFSSVDHPISFSSMDLADSWSSESSVDHSNSFSSVDHPISFSSMDLADSWSSESSVDPEVTQKTLKKQSRVQKFFGV
ncbi:hypothetical protein CRUP_013682, partial [Coryphaenoides rupestris]